ncbi:hypothetical protein RHS01_08077 [Rhizoctonia solani]|uniref:Uncharacterized protein n=1 Tax=Rhizoctonia solani TaxID=456999 RepID=A0A8H7I6Q9_9AGAM|nr:hypothetical protein RHS01_08077 [Rhizoctonia solani]
MATRSRPPSRARSPIDQGELGPFLPPASPELGKVSLERVIRLLWGLQSQVDRIERTLLEQAEISREVRTNVENISQTVNVVKDGLAQLQLARGPHTPEEQKPPAVEETPRAAPKAEPIGKAQPFLGPQPPSSPQGPLGATPFPYSIHTPPPPSLRDRLQLPRTSTSACHYPGAASSPLHCKSGPPRCLQRQNWLGGQTMANPYVGLGAPQPEQFPLDMEVLSFLLMNMTEAAGAWAHPHLDQLGSHCALIQTVDEFKTEFLAAFGDPDATRAASGRLLPSHKPALVPNILLSSARCKWNSIGTMPHSAVSSREDSTGRSKPATRNRVISLVRLLPTPIGDEYRQQATKTGPLSSDPNYVSEEERNRRRAEGLCATPKEDKGKAKETAKIGNDSEYQSGKEEASGTLRSPDRLRRHIIIPTPQTAELLRLPLIDLPQPRTVTMLDGSSPQAGKIWKKAHLTFLFDGKRMTETFLICNTGSHAAILGIKWLENHNPEINWNSRTLSFPHTPPEHVAIAEEEEADKNPWKDMTDAESATLKDWLRDELKAGKIRPSKSSISSPVMFVPKKDGSRRLVVDYRCLNNRTKKNVYPLPRPDDLMAQLRGAKVFTKLDLRWGYNNVRVKEGDEWKTAFRTKYGLYKSLVMTFGLTNAPAAFQHFMNKLFKDLLDVCVIIYLNDILIYSKDDATHTQHVHEVLRCLMENQLFCKASKCTFHVTSVEYLGIIVSDKGFSLDKLKIQAVQEWPTPTKVKEVQLFLGFANFLRRFVANFSHVARPLHNLVKKDVPWKWDTREQEAFQGLKRCHHKAPVLCHADPAKPYFLETDASGAALGSILSQRQEDGRLHPLGFLSESFKGAEQNYDTHDKELLAIIRSLSTGYWKESRTFNRRHARWHLLLAGYNFQIVYRPGKQSGKPDALSRRSDHADIPPDAQTMLPSPVFANVALVTPEKELQRQIELSLDQDESLEEILHFLQNESKAPPQSNAPLRITKWKQACCSTKGKFRPPRQTTDPRTGIQNYYWPGIRADTYWHVDSCETCQRIRKPKYASIPPQPLELPVKPWQHVSYDMIIDLPKDGSNDSILVIVDSFTKYGIFVKCSKKLKAPELAELFLEHVWKRHGMPEKTVSDRGRVFNNKFLRALYKRLGIDPHFSSAYHPQSDGQTERVNPSIEHFLRAYSGENTIQALYGWEPTLTPSNVPTDVPEADDLAQTMETQWKEVESALRQSKQRMTAGEDGSPIEFEIGEEAWLDAKNVNLKTLSPKLTEQRLGPFKVIEKISDRAYCLELPPTMRIHDVFYVGLLSKVKRDKKRAFENRPPPVTVDGEEEYEVEGITNAEERNGKWFFRVKWKGYGSEENTWEPRENLKNAEKILKKYEEDMRKKALGAAKALKGGAVS